ncbi:MAG: hypothetical protein K9M51_01515 [Candidatus Gracilibacteria bacterium]|nr:hypothetical protein [Candidatus Gracilibacteria bacterium]
MKTSKKIGIGIASTALALSLFSTPMAQAFWGGGSMGHGPQKMSEEHFEEMKSLFLTNDFESFQSAMEARHEEMKAEHKSMRDSITHSVELIDNGVIKTITSDDAEVVEKLQSREYLEPRQETISREIEQMANGVKITITSNDAEEVERIQARAERFENGSRMRGRFQDETLQGQEEKNSNSPRFGRGMGRRGTGQRGMNR